MAFGLTTLHGPGSMYPPHTLHCPSSLLCFARPHMGLQDSASNTRGPCAICLDTPAERIIEAVELREPPQRTVVGETTRSRECSRLCDLPKFVDAANWQTGACLTDPVDCQIEKVRPQRVPAHSTSDWKLRLCAFSRRCTRKTPVARKRGSCREGTGVCRQQTPAHLLGSPSRRHKMRRQGDLPFDIGHGCCRSP